MEYFEFTIFYKATHTKDWNKNSKIAIIKLCVFKKPLFNHIMNYIALYF